MPLYVLKICFIILSLVSRRNILKDFFTRLLLSLPPYICSKDRDIKPYVHFINAIYFNYYNPSSCRCSGGKSCYSTNISQYLYPKFFSSSMCQFSSLHEYYECLCLWFSWWNSWFARFGKILVYINRRFINKHKFAMDQKRHMIMMCIRCAQLFCIAYLDIIYAHVSLLNLYIW